MKAAVKLTLGVLGSGILLTGCGGGGSSESGIVTSGTSVSSSVSGRVSDGPVSNSKVWFDLNNNYQYDSGEPFDMTDQQGLYQINGVDTIHAGVRLRASGGTDTDTNLPFEGVLEAKPQARAGSVTQMLTPLTTLKSQGLSENNLRQMFPELPNGDVDQIDPESDASIHRAGVMVHTIAVQVSDTGKQAGGTVPVQDIYRELATEAVNNPSGFVDMDLKGLMERNLPLDSEHAAPIASVLGNVLEHMAGVDLSGDTPREKLRLLQVAATEQLDVPISNFVSGVTSDGDLTQIAFGFFPPRRGEGFPPPPGAGMPFPREFPANMREATHCY
jgi:hypothetical protein